VTSTPGDAPSKTFVLTHLAVCSFFWGNSFLFMKLIGDGLNPLVMASLRALGALAVLAVVVAMLGQSIVPKGREWRDWAALGTFNGWVPNSLVAFALLHMDSGPAALIQSSGPLMTAALAHFFLNGERLNAQKIIGIVIGLIGVALLIGPQAMTGKGSALAILAMLAVTLGYALGNIYTRSIPRAEPLRLALGQQMASSIFATILAFGLFGWAGYAPASNHIVPLLLLSVISTAIPIWFFMRLITYAGPTKAALTGYLVPAVAVVMGIIVLREPILLRQIIGGLIVLTSVALVTGALKFPTLRSA
jgi:drug/metabolite transporter (DMT)-like permease